MQLSSRCSSDRRLLRVRRAAAHQRTELSPLRAASARARAPPARAQQHEARRQRDRRDRHGADVNLSAAGDEALGKGGGGRYQRQHGGVDKPVEDAEGLASRDRPDGLRLLGRWRIVAADLWERDHLDLCGPATLDIRADGHGELAFGAFQASLELAYGYSDVSFDWAGFDEMDEVRGSGSAELLEDGSLEIDSSAITATRLSLKLNARLLQQPARSISSLCSDTASAASTSPRSRPPARLKKTRFRSRPRLCASDDADASGDHLQIVFYPMLQFAQLRVLFSNAGFERLRIQFHSRHGADERHQPVGRGSGSILDHIRM